MSDVTDLKAEVLLLRKENKELRELAQRLLTEYYYIRVRPRKMYLQHERRMRVIENEMRSLGIEVDKCMGRPRTTFILF